MATMPRQSLAALLRTPGQVLGPYYPVGQRFPHTHDLTRPHGGIARALGELIHISGRVLTREGEAVPHARIEIWQANAAGRYRHPSDTSGLPLDPNFDGVAVFETDSDGRYAFLTVKPGPYPWDGGMRTRHIHYEVTGRADRLVTQVYFPGEKLNATDFFLRQAPRPRDLLLKLVSEPHPGKPQEAIFDVVLFTG